MNLPINIKTPQEMANKANEIDNGLHHKEAPRISCWFYIWEDFKREFKILFKFKGF